MSSQRSCSSCQPATLYFALGVRHTTRRECNRCAEDRDRPMMHRTLDKALWQYTSTHKKTLKKAKITRSHEETHRRRLLHQICSEGNPTQTARTPQSHQSSRAASSRKDQLRNAVLPLRRTPRLLQHLQKAHRLIHPHSGCRGTQEGVGRVSRRRSDHPLPPRQETPNRTH